MESKPVVCLKDLALNVPEDHRPTGTRVLDAVISLAESAMQQLAIAQEGRPTALVSRLRGSGRGISLSSLLGELDLAHPLLLEYPFEGSSRVGGAVWMPRSVGIQSDTSLAKLRWEAGADDLPMHVHDHSDRFIIVRSGRGFFHVTDESAERFSGTKVRTVPARERDVFLFSRGIVHTFSTDREPMELLSCQLPFLAFDDPRQYRLPKTRWVASECPDTYPVSIFCDPGWMTLATAMGG